MSGYTRVLTAREVASQQQAARSTTDPAVTFHLEIQEQKLSARFQNKYNKSNL